MSVLAFTVYSKPVPQGSNKAFVVKGKARITSDNTKLKPFRSEVTRCAIQEMVAQGMQPPLAQKESVSLHLLFVFSKPKSAKKRVHPTVKPDLDKLCRGILDALTGVVYTDDAQVVFISARKVYENGPEHVTITAEVGNE